MITITDLLSRFEKVYGSGPQYSAMCPVHNTKSKGLGIKDCGHRIILNCFSGCNVVAILAEVGLTYDDINPPRTPSARKEMAYLKKMEKESKDMAYCEMVLALYQDDILNGISHGYNDLKIINNCKRYIKDRLIKEEKS